MCVISRSVYQFHGELFISCGPVRNLSKPVFCLPPTDSDDSRRRQTSTRFILKNRITTRIREIWKAHPSIHSNVGSCAVHIFVWFTMKMIKRPSHPPPTPPASPVGPAPPPKCGTGIPPPLPPRLWPRVGLYWPLAPASSLLYI